MKTPRGMSFIDVVVGTGIMLVVFLSIFAAYSVAIDLVMNTKAKIGGMALATQKLEYLRGLPYENLGTIGGIPSGTLPQLATTTLNGIPYTVRTLIKYIDDPADGFGGADTNAITADYKEVKVEILWSIRTRPYSTFGVTRVAPHGIESLTSGGTLRVNVFDALAQPVQGASVLITNVSASPAINVTVSTDITGSVAFPGAPPASNYKITVTKEGYSSAQTYDITVQNPNPNPGHVSVANQQTTTASFAIDRTGSLDVRTYSPIDVGAYEDDLASDTGLAATTSVAVVGDELILLEDVDTGYALTGTARFVPITPAELTSWDLLSWSDTTPPNTDLSLQVLYLSGGTWVPVPDSAIVGNSTGLTSNSVSLAAVSTSTYPSLALGAALSTSNASTTPALLDWRIDYHAGPSPLPGIGFTAYGTKTIGTTISGAPIYKVVQNQTTSQAGSWLIIPIEWDSYTVQLTGTSHDIAEECPSPVSVLPTQSQVVSLSLVPHSTNSLRVLVTGSGAALPGATVTLTSPGNEIFTTSACGQVFFGGLTTDTYTLTVSKTGFQTNQQDISIADRTVITVPLTP